MTHVPRLPGSSRLAAAVAAVRLAIALLTLAAIGYQCVTSSGRPAFSAANLFSFFTIESNILGAAVLLWAAVKAGRARSRRFEYVRGAATLFIAITGVVFALPCPFLDADSLG
jgi:hypothetical protein